MSKRKLGSDEEENFVSDASASASSDDSASDSQPSDVEEIETANALAHAKKTKKRKRALSPDAFGDALSQLLALPGPSDKTVSRLHSKPLKSAQEIEEGKRQKQLKALRATKHEREERGHVADLIGGWTARPAKPWSQWNETQDEIDIANGSMETVPGGAVAEKALRRLAQKGVVQLFNAIKAAQTTEEEITSKPKLAKSLPLQNTTQDSLTATAEAKLPNLLGSKGKEQALANLSKETFLQILKSQSQSQATSAEKA